MRSRLMIFLVMILGSFMVAGCGGGGGGSSAGSDSGTGTGGSGSGGSDGGTSSSQTLQFIESPSGLLAHNPAAPGTISTIDADADFSNVNSIPVLGATWDNGQTDSTYVERVVYGDSAGHVMQVSTDSSGGVTPTPTQISEENNGACEFNIGPDFANPSESRVAYERCDTGEWWWTFIGAEPDRKPVPFNSVPVVELLAVSDGSHDGWLALDSGEIKRYPPDSNTLESISGSPTGIGEVRHLESIQDGSVMLNIDGELWVYNPANGLTDLSYSFVNDTCVLGPANCPELWVVDGSELYFIDDNKLFGTEVANDQVVELDQAVSTPQFEFGGQRLAVNSDRVVWSYETDPTPSTPLSGDEETVLRTIDKSTGSGSDLRRINLLSPIASAPNQPFFDRTGDWFFYTRTDSAGGTPTAVAQRMDGSGNPVEYSGAVWQGASVNFSSLADLNVGIDRVFLVDGVTSASGDFANKNIKSVAGSDPGTTINLGTTPSDVEGLLLIGGFSIDRLGQITADDGSGGTQEDILFLDAETAGSLQRVTNTNNESERVSPFF